MVNFDKLEKGIRELRFEVGLITNALNSVYPKLEYEYTQDLVRNFLNIIETFKDLVDDLERVLKKIKEEHGGDESGEKA